VNLQIWQLLRQGKNEFLFAVCSAGKVDRCPWRMVFNWQLALGQPSDQPTRHVCLLGLYGARTARFLGYLGLMAVVLWKYLRPGLAV